MLTSISSHGNNIVQFLIDYKFNSDVLLTSVLPLSITRLRQSIRPIILSRVGWKDLSFLWEPFRKVNNVASQLSVVSFCFGFVEVESTFYPFFTHFSSLTPAILLTIRQAKQATGEKVLGTKQLSSVALLWLDQDELKRRTETVEFGCDK